MKAFILAAGLGKRMMPLTAERPKPLLEAGGVPLLLRLIRRLRASGFDELVINTSVYPEQFEQLIGDGQSENVRIRYSHEGPAPLNTADGIRAALHLLGDSPFLLINADVYTDFDFASLKLAFDRQAHLLLTDNPGHNPEGDFAIDGDGGVHALRMPDNHPDSPGPPLPDNAQCWTYCGIAVISPALLLEAFGLATPSLAEVLALACAHKLVSAQTYHGQWRDIGTPERLSELDKHLSRTDGKAVQPARRQSSKPRQ